jgi:hypothetical protein
VDAPGVLRVLEGDHRLQAPLKLCSSKTTALLSHHLQTCMNQPHHRDITLARLPSSGKLGFWPGALGVGTSQQPPRSSTPSLSLSLSLSLSPSSLHPLLPLARGQPRPQCR